MANQFCEGAFFFAEDHWWYQCAWDSTVIDISDNEIIRGSKCTNCDRIAHGQSYGVVSTRVKRIVQALLPNGTAAVIHYTET